MRSEFKFNTFVRGVKASNWVHFCKKSVLQNVGGSEWVQSQKRLGAEHCKDWHGLHKSG